MFSVTEKSENPSTEWRERVVKNNFVKWYFRQMLLNGC